MVLGLHGFAGRGCRHCAIEKRHGVSKPKRGLLKNEHPELVGQLHPCKNAHKDLDSVTCGSMKVAVWVCTNCEDDPLGCPHPREWKAGIQTRTKGSGCPYCTGKRVCPCKSLAQLVPEVAAQWHPTRNGDQRPGQVGQYSNQKVWWQHRCDQTGEMHEWPAQTLGCVTAWQKEHMLSCPKCKSYQKLGLIGKRRGNQRRLSS